MSGVRVASEVNRLVGNTSLLVLVGGLAGWKEAAYSVSDKESP